MEVFLAELLEACQARGVEETAIVHAHDHASVSVGARTESGVEIIRVPSWGRFLYAPISPFFGQWLERAIVRINPDVIHLHMPNTSAFWLLGIAAAKRIPWVVHWHSDVVSSRVDRRLALAYQFYRPFEQALLRRARAIIATSPPYLAASKALAPWREKCHVIPLGKSLQPAPVADELSVAESVGRWGNAPFRILAVGRLTYYKGHETLIRAMRELPDAKLILVGSGERKSKLERMIYDLNISDRVSLAGYMPDESLAALMAGCHVFCLPSIERTEAFGVVLLEAMCAAKPVVASNIEGSGVGWVVEHGKTGLLTEPGNVSALANALAVLKENTQLSRALGDAGRARFVSNFQIARIADDIIKVYQLTTADGHAIPNVNQSLDSYSCPQ